jgi:hypothetical protein
MAVHLFVPNLESQIILVLRPKLITAPTQHPNEVINFPPIIWEFTYYQKPVVRFENRWLLHGNLTADNGLGKVVEESRRGRIVVIYQHAKY